MSAGTRAESLPAAPAAAFRLRGFGLSHRTHQHERVLLEDVDLEVPAGSFLLLVGPSGAGKSSLFRLLTGLWEVQEPPPQTRGELELLGHRVDGRYPEAVRGRVSAVLQDEGLLDELSPRQNVELALRIAGRSRRLAPALLGQAGLPEPPGQVAALSGGMRKRVAIARALAAEPDLFLFDEPTAGLDAASARAMAELLHDTHGRSGARTTIVATHDVPAFAGLADGVLLLDAGARQLRLIDAGERLPDEVLRPGAGNGDEAGDPLYGLRRWLLRWAALGQDLGAALWRLPPVFPVVTGRAVLRFCLQPVFFSVLACSTIGGLATYFALRNNPLEDAATAQVLTGVGKVLSAVLIPLLSGFFFTARMAAGAAARLGTMKRTNQIAALRMMGVRPADYLLTPLTWGMAIALPVITAAGVAWAAMASFLAATWVGGITPEGWVQAFFETVDLADLRFVLLKSAVSGFLVAVLTYHLATGPKRSGREVGEAVNASIVQGMVAVLFVHGLLTILQYG